ncbi:MAG: response regulator [Cohnella sp.]|nr:response regulator [Cohnella sp.]
MATINLLIAEDEAILRFLLTETLTDEGYAVAEATDGREAKTRLEQEEFDLIVLDFMMPEMTGVEVCEWLRKSDNPNRDKPVILLTAKAQDKDRELAKHAGVTAYVVKPFSPLNLLDTVGQLISKGNDAHE